MCLKAIQWWGDELDRLGVDLRLGQEGSPADVVELQPSVTLLATGSRPIGAATDSALPAARIRGHSPGWSHLGHFVMFFSRCFSWSRAIRVSILVPAHSVRL